MQIHDDYHSKILFSIQCLAVSLRYLHLQKLVDLCNIKCLARSILRSSLPIAYFSISLYMLKKLKSSGLVFCSLILLRYPMFHNIHGVLYAHIQHISSSTSSQCFSFILPLSTFTLALILPPPHFALFMLILSYIC